MSEAHLLTFQATSPSPIISVKCEKNRAFTVPIRGNGYALELGAGCLRGETFLYLSGVLWHVICCCQ